MVEFLVEFVGIPFESAVLLVEVDENDFAIINADQGWRKDVITAVTSVTNENRSNRLVHNVVAPWQRTQRFGWTDDSSLSDPSNPFEDLVFEFSFSIWFGDIFCHGDIKCIAVTIIVKSRVSEIEIWIVI